jgi:metabotropic X receptor
MLYTVDRVNSLGVLPPPLKLGAYVLDDCDKDTYGLQQAVDFIKGEINITVFFLYFTSNFC